MNKKTISILILTILTMVWTVCYATDSSNVVELDQNTDEYINSYEEYEQLMNEQDSGYTQEELKQYYNEYQKGINEYYNGYERDKTVRAKVVKTEKVQEEYELNEYYYSISKYEFQPITVEIIEGEHKGETFKIDYLLTGDSLNNIKYSELKRGDTIYVGFFVNEETGETYADITNAGSNVERFWVVGIIGLITFALVIIYGGRKGLMATLIALLILDFCLIIIPNMGYMGQGFVIGGDILIVLIILIMSLMKFGFNIKMLKALLISTGGLIIAGILMALFNSLTRTVGITFETAAISENVVLGNMNFENLYIIITLIIASVFITKIVCETIEKISTLNTNIFNEILSNCKNLLGPNVITLVDTLFATYIPNHLLLLTNKYTSSEIWNSEILISELLRMFAIIISMTLAIPMVVVLDENKEK